MLCCSSAIARLSQQLLEIEREDGIVSVAHGDASSTVHDNVSSVYSESTAVSGVASEVTSEAVSDGVVSGV